MKKTKNLTVVLTLVVLALMAVGVGLYFQPQLLDEPYRLFMAYTNETVREVLRYTAPIVLGVFVTVLVNSGTGLLFWTCSLLVFGLAYLYFEGYMDGPYTAYLNWFITSFGPNEMQYLVVAFFSPLVFGMVLITVLDGLWYALVGWRYDYEDEEEEDTDEDGRILVHVRVEPPVKPPSKRQLAREARQREQAEEDERIRALTEPLPDQVV